MCASVRHVVLACLVSAWLAGAASAQKIHALLVADISPSAQWGIYESNLNFDMMHMTGMLEMNVPEGALEIHYLTIEEDEQSTPAAVVAALRQLRPRRNDTVLFYFTGHGGLDDRGSYFSLAGGKLYRDTIRGMMTAMNPRLSVMVTDCCNSRSDGRLQIVAAPQYPRPDNFTPLFQELMLRPSGVVDVNSSAPGESAFFPPASPDDPSVPGSIFTTALTEWAEEHAKRRVGWADLLREVGVKVHLAFRAAFPKGVSMAKGAPVQTDQTVFARDYPGIPEARGYRVGIQARDNDGRGAVIVEIVADSPATNAYDPAGEQYVALRTGMNITAVNGKMVSSADDFRALVASSPQIMRLTIDPGNAETRDYLVRLRY